MYALVLGVCTSSVYVITVLLTLVSSLVCCQRKAVVQCTVHCVPLQ
jgi:hypothetical protein